MVENDEAPINEKDALDLLPGYVMGILEQDELSLVERFIQNAPNIAARLKAMDESISTLAFAASPQLPTTDIKSRVMSRAIDHRNSDPRTATIRIMTADSDPSLDTQRVFNANRVPNKARKLQSAQAPEGFELLDVSMAWWRRALGWKIATGLATAAAIGLLVFTLQNQSVDQGMQTELAMVKGDLASLQSELDMVTASNEELVSSKQALEIQLASQTLDPDAQIARLSNAQQAVFFDGTDEAPEANGSFFASSDNVGTLLLTGLDPLPDEQTYQLWLIPVEGEPVSAGLFAVSDDGTTLVTLDLPAAGQDFSRMGISIEPSLGSPIPTGPLVLLGT